MNREVLPEFVQVLQDTLAYWLRLTAALDDALIIQIDPDRRNLRDALTMGLSLPQTCALASEVAWQTFFLAEQRGYWPEWISFFKRALADCPSLSPQQRHRCLYRLGELHRHTQNLTEAVATHQQAEALAQELDDELALAEARSRLCWDYLEMRQYKEAEVCCRFAIDTFTRLNIRRDLLTNSYWAWGSLARRRGELDAAQERLSQAIEMALATQQPTHRARMITELGNILSGKELYDEALACYDEAAEMLAGTASERDKVFMQINRAIIFYRQERWPEVESVWRHVVNSAYVRQSGELHLQAMVAYNLATALLKTGDLVEAEAQLKYALRLRIELQDKVRQGSILGALAQLRLRQGKQDEAISLFEQVRQLLEAYPDDAYAQRVLRTIEAEQRDLRR